MSNPIGRRLRLPRLPRTPRTPRTRRRLLLRPLRIILVLGLVLAGIRMTGLAERLFYHPTREATPVPDDLVAGAERVTFTSADGTTLVGWFLPARDPRRAPSVLHTHGNAGSLNSHFLTAGWLPARGVNVLMFDYRGYGESDGRPRSRGPLIADAHAALDALIARADVDPARIGVLGQSLGGAIGINLMAARDEIRAGAFISPFTSWREVGAASISGDPPAAPARWLARVLLSDAHRPIDAVKTIRRPLLVVHGRGDEIVPVSHGLRLAEVAPNGSFLEVPDAGHVDLPMEFPDAQARIAEFLIEALH